MSKANYLRSLRRRIAAIDVEMVVAMKKFERTSPRDRVEAAGELTVLRRRKADLVRKTARVERAPSGLWEELRWEVDQDLDALRADIEHFVIGH